MKLKLNLLILLSIITSTLAKSQVLDSVSMSFENGLVVVQYDFLVGEADKEYELYLYGSHDNFTNPLQYTTGDVGKKIKLGEDKKILWDAKTELGNFKGDFSLKIKGSIYTPLVQYKNIDDDLKIKRGNAYDIQWTSSVKADKLLLKIQRHGVPLIEPQVIENTGSYLWELPEKTKPGKGYSIQLSDTENLLREETSNEFSIRRKVSLTYIIAPVVVVAGVTAILLIGGPEDPNTIPLPPNTPEN